MKYKEIFLNQEQVALVDVEDYEWLNQRKWRSYKDHNTYYAVRTIRKGEKWTAQKMHREILEIPKNMDTDHINGNGLDNRKENLRACTNSQNQANRGMPINNTSGYKGVCWYKANRKWQAQIKINKKQIYLGRYSTKEQAALIYNEAALKYHGKFARLNNVKSVNPDKGGYFA